MDIATIIGLVFGIIVMLGSILIAGASFGAFIDYPSIVCVIGGAIAATLIAIPLKNFLATGKVALKTMFYKPDDVRDLIKTLVSLAETARRDGLLALEAKQSEISNKFIVLGIQMAVDGSRPEVIEDVLKTEMDAVATRHSNGKLVVDHLGRFAPAWGMIGTLMGLVIMLGNMDDPAAIGPGMAVALLTTLYGAVMSNLFCLPMSEKLAFTNKQELLAMDIILRGIMAIQSGDNPRVIEQKLSTFIPPKQRAGAQEAA